MWLKNRGQNKVGASVLPVVDMLEIRSEDGTMVVILSGLMLFKLEFTISLLLLFLDLAQILVQVQSPWLQSWHLLLPHPSSPRPLNRLILCH